MVKKRILGVVTVKDNWVVQSFGYNKYLPVGRPECIIENLDRWGADEILVQVIDRSKDSRGPDFELLRRIGKLSLSTPLIYAGGIQSESDAVEVIKHGADRLVIDYLLRSKPEVITDLASYLGSQAIIASLPVYIIGSDLNLFNYDDRTSEILSSKILDIISDKKIISEVLLINVKGEGYHNTFSLELVNNFPIDNISFIAFGGMSDPDLINSLLNHKNVSAVAIGNSLNYKEHSIQSIKGFCDNNNVRKPDYHSNI